MSALRATVTGRVQGVGFREATRERALELGLTGWVLNADDGTVQVHAEGDATDELAAWLHEGPPHAHVEDAHIVTVDAEGHEQFAIRGIPAGRFTVHADGSAFVLTLEVTGGPRHWHLPKEPTSTRHLAIETDAPGAGAIWDHGPYEQRGRVAWPEALDRGHAMVLFHGEQLQGGYALQRTKPSQWLLLKRKQ